MTSPPSSSPPLAAAAVGVAAAKICSSTSETASESVPPAALDAPDDLLGDECAEAPPPPTPLIETWETSTSDSKSWVYSGTMLWWECSPSWRPDADSVGSSIGDLGGAVCTGLCCLLSDSTDLVAVSSESFICLWMEAYSPSFSSNVAQICSRLFVLSLDMISAISLAVYLRVSV